MNTYEKGSLGEAMAEKYLKRRGFRILEKNYRVSHLAEIDIIAMHGKILVFVEVKMRTSLLRGYGREAVTFKKQENIRYAARHYLLTRLKKEVPCRFDVLEITLLDGTCDIQLIENAF